MSLLVTPNNLLAAHTCPCWHVNINKINCLLPHDSKYYRILNSYNDKGCVFEILTPLPGIELITKKP